MENLQSKLFEAATQSSISSLHLLLKDDPLILNRCFVNRFNETPLHVAAMLGHVDFVKEIIALKPQLVNELNSQRSSSLHLASANGHVDVVNALLSVDSQTCMDRDRNEMSPLHLAAANGRVETMKLLLEAQPEAMYGGGEKILHLCVKRYQLEALKLLMVKSDCDKVFVNSKDTEGNTVLHLAVADKQVETIKYLVSIGAVEVNAQNNERITALDVLIRSRRDLRDSEIEKTLKNVGGFGTMENNMDNLSAKKNRQESLEKEPYAGWVDSNKSSLMVVASLIATMAFQIGVNPPGGVWQDDSNLEGKAGAKKHEAGTSVFVDRYPDLYKFFYSVNTTAFVASLSVILLLTSGLPISRRIFVWILIVITWIAIIATAVSYIYAIYIVIPTDLDHAVWNMFERTLVVWIVLIALLLVTHTIRIIVKLVKMFRKARMEGGRRSSILQHGWLAHEAEPQSPI